MRPSVHSEEQNYEGYVVYTSDVKSSQGNDDVIGNSIHHHHHHPHYLVEPEARKKGRGMDDLDLIERANDDLTFNTREQIASSYHHQAAWNLPVPAPTPPSVLVTFLTLLQWPHCLRRYSHNILDCRCRGDRGLNPVLCTEERVKNHLGKTTLRTPNQDYNPDLPVIGSLVYCESNTLAHVATKAVSSTIKTYKYNSMASARNRAIATEWLPTAGKDSANCWQRYYQLPRIEGIMWSAQQTLRSEMILFRSSIFSFVLKRLSLTPFRTHRVIEKSACVHLSPSLSPCLDRKLPNGDVTTLARSASQSSAGTVDKTAGRRDK
ncbi:unnamed protein product, partial [Timema podura]|nr:unnamed protein product [Timema podura]